MFPPWLLCVQDFLVLLASIASFILENVLPDSNGGFIRVFRLGRTLRPLRVIQRNENMRIVVGSLIHGFKDVMSVYLLSQFVYIIFAILGLNLFAGLFKRCKLLLSSLAVRAAWHSPPPPSLFSGNDDSITHKDECVGTFMLDGQSVERVWENPRYGDIEDLIPFSFDNFGQAYLTLMEILTLEGFTDVIAAAMDITGRRVLPLYQYCLPPVTSHSYGASLHLHPRYGCRAQYAAAVQSLGRLRHLLCADHHGVRVFHPRAFRCRYCRKLQPL